jgi:CDP-diacylglycerol--serine O-phosphatidyltransferase
VFAFIFTNPPLMLFVIFSAYAVSGPALTLLRLRKMRSERRV